VLKLLKEGQLPFAVVMNTADGNVYAVRYNQDAADKVDIQEVQIMAVAEEGGKFWGRMEALVGDEVSGRLAEEVSLRLMG
jgi:hypothetical protein